MKYATPQPLIEILKEIEQQTAKLSAAAANLEVARKFTLDGRLVGDIGEMLAAQHMELKLDETQRRGHDGVAKIHGKDYQVQIKCRKATDAVSFSTVPELLVVIQFGPDWGNWEIVYNGPGEPLVEVAAKWNLKVDADGRIHGDGKRDTLDLNLNLLRQLAGESSYKTSIKVPMREVPLSLFPAERPPQYTTAIA